MNIIYSIMITVGISLLARSVNLAMPMGWPYFVLNGLGTFLVVAGLHYLIQYHTKGHK